MAAEDGERVSINVKLYFPLLILKILFRVPFEFFIRRPSFFEYSITSEI